METEINYRKARKHMLDLALFLKQCRLPDWTEILHPY